MDQPFPQSSPLHNENISFYRLFYMWQESGKLLRIYSGKRRLNVYLSASWCFKRFCFSEIPIFFQKLSYLEEKIMSQNESYHINESLRNDLRLRKILNDLRTFFRYIITKNPSLQYMQVRDITIAHLEQLSVHDIESYLSYLKCYHPDEQEHRTIHNDGRNQTGNVAHKG